MSFRNHLGRAEQRARRAGQAPYALRGPVGGGSFGSNSLAIPLSRWAGGGAWDARSLPGGANGSAIATPWASLVGSIVGTPNGIGGVTPQLYASSVGGLPAAHFPTGTTGGIMSWFSFDALAPIFQGAPGPFAIALHMRSCGRFQGSLVSVLRGDGNAAEQLMLKNTVSQLGFLKKTAAGGTTQLNTGVLPSQLQSDLMVGFQYNGAGSLAVYSQDYYQRTFTKTTFAFPVDPLTAGVNRYSLMATVSSVPFEATNGYVTKHYCAPTIFTDAEWQTQFNQWLADNYVTTQFTPGAIVTSIPGDSETTASNNDLWPNLTGPILSWRGVLGQFVSDNGLSVFSYSNTLASSGTGAPGTFLSAVNGSDIATIQAQALADISAAAALGSPIGYVSLFMGDGDNNALVAPATIAARYLAAAQTIMTAALAANPNCIFTGTTLPPISPIGGALDVNLNAFNALLPGVWATLRAQFPAGRLYTWNAWLALTGVWTALCFGADTAHPNHYGCVQEGTHPVYGLLAALNELGEKFGVALRRLSRSAPHPVALTVAVTSPAPAAVLPNGAPVTITGKASRVGGRVDAVLASQSGMALWTDFLVYSAGSGGSNVSPGNRWSLTLTPPIGDVGAKNLIVTMTDIDGTTTAQTIVPVTIS